jgi:hypothetical protein
MRILFDTNIFIYREDHHVVPEELQQLLKILSQIRAVPLVHPKSISDIDNDTDGARRAIVKSKVMSYPTLEDPPDYRADQDFIAALGATGNPRDQIDNALLYAVFKHAVSYLVTADRQMFRKAVTLNIRDKVLSVAEAYQFFQQLLPNEIVSHPWALKDDYVYNLDLGDPFFDSLRAEYSGFDDWFKTVASVATKCWVYLMKDGRIGALLIRKIEDEAIDSTPPMQKSKRLKICSLKVGPTDYKIGELFIKLAGQYAVNNGINEIYLTHFTRPDPDDLAELIAEYGFQVVGRNRRGEDIYLKQLLPDKENAIKLTPTEISKRYWPCFYDGPNVKKFIIPIRPVYHDRLFVELKEQVSLFEMAGEFIVEGNTIKKAYLCHSKSKKILPGSVLLFYRSQRKQALTALGVVEQMYTGIQDRDSILSLIDKRTVYSAVEIARMLEKPTTLILFTWHCYLSKSMPLNRLQAIGALSAPPQSIVEVSHEVYLRLKAEGGIDERLAFN